MKIPRMATLTAYGDAVGPLGFPMRSEAAFELEKAIKQISADVRGVFKTLVDGREVDNLVRRSMSHQIEFDENERADVSMVTSASIDRDREIVLPKGVDWSSFKKNPVVSFAHDYRILPVGRAMWWARNKDVKDGDPATDGWLAKTQYLARPAEWKGDWWIDAVWHMVKNKFLPGKSIGFIPLEGRPPSADDIKKAPYMADARFIFTKVHIVEYAVAPVQSNPDALVQGVAKSFDAGFKIPESIMPLLTDFFWQQKGADEFLSELLELEDEPTPLPSIKNCRIIAPVNIENMVETAVNKALGKTLC